MDPLVLIILFVLVTFSIVSLILQALTMRSVRSASSDRTVEPPIQGREFAAPSRKPDAGHGTDLKLPCSQLPEKDRPVPSPIKPRLPPSDPQWQWRSYKKYVKKNGDSECKEIGEEVDAAVDGPFKVHYPKRVDLEVSRFGIFSPFPDTTEVLVTSPSLIEVLQRYLPDHGDLKSVAEPLVAGRDLYMALQSLKSHASEVCVKYPWGDFKNEFELAPNGSQSADRGSYGVELGVDGTKEPVTVADSSLGTLYVKHLVRFLEREYKDLLKRQSRMREENCVSWDMLWAFLSKGTKVGYYCRQSGELLCAMVTAAHYDRRMKYDREFHGEQIEICDVELEVCDFDGRRYKACKIRRYIERFHEEQNFCQLAVCPIETLGDPSDLEKKFLANGERFYELSVRKSSRFMCYEGSMYIATKENRNIRAGSGFLEERDFDKKKADGRVMIDLDSFAAMNPNYPMENA